MAAVLVVVVPALVGAGFAAQPVARLIEVDPARSLGQTQRSHQAANPPPTTTTCMAYADPAGAVAKD